MVSDTVCASYDEIAESELLLRAATRATSTSSRVAIEDRPGATSSGVRAPDQQPACGQAPRMGEAGAPPAARRRTGLAVLAFTVIAIAAIWWAATIMATKESRVSPGAAILKSISATRWRGTVGRSPASLNVFSVSRKILINAGLASLNGKAEVLAAVSKPSKVPLTPSH